MSSCSSTVFVFAFTGITGLVREHLTLLGVAHAALVFWLVWWAWTQFTWTLNPADTNHPAVRNITLAACAAAFFMAEAVPAAFAEAGLMFAIAYAVVRLLGLGLQLKVASHGEVLPALHTSPASRCSASSRCSRADWPARPGANGCGCWRS